MGAFSDFMEAKIVDSFLRNTAYTPAATVYLALYTSDPGEATGGAEVAYTNYARKSAAWTALDVNGQTKNADLVSFAANGNPVASVTITHVAIFDALTGGNKLMYAALTSPKTLAPGDVLAFAANACVFTLD